MFRLTKILAVTTLATLAAAKNGIGPRDTKCIPTDSQGVITTECNSPPKRVTSTSELVPIATKPITRTVHGNRIVISGSEILIKPSTDPVITITASAPKTKVGGEDVFWDPDGEDIIIGPKTFPVFKALTTEKVPLPPVGAVVKSTVVREHSADTILTSTIVQTFVKTTYQKYTGLVAKTTVHTTETIGLDIFPRKLVIYPGGIGWKDPRVTDGTLLPQPTTAPKGADTLPIAKSTKKNGSPRSDEGPLPTLKLLPVEYPRFFEDQVSTDPSATSDGVSSTTDDDGDWIIFPTFGGSSCFFCPDDSGLVFPHLDPGVYPELNLPDLPKPLPPITIDVGQKPTYSKEEPEEETEKESSQSSSESCTKETAVDATVYVSYRLNTASETISSTILSTEVETITSCSATASTVTSTVVGKCTPKPKIKGRGIYPRNEDDDCTTQQYYIFPLPGTSSSTVVKSIAQELERMVDPVDIHVAFNGVDDYGVDYWEVPLTINQANKLKQNTNVYAIAAQPPSCGDAPGCVQNPWRSSYAIETNTSVKYEAKKASSEHRKLQKRVDSNWVEELVDQDRQYLTFLSAPKGIGDRDNFVDVLGSTWVYQSTQGEGITVYMFDSGANIELEEFENIRERTRWAGPEWPRARKNPKGYRNANIRWKEPVKGDYKAVKGEHAQHGTDMLGVIAGKTNGVARNIDPVVVRDGYPEKGPTFDRQLSTIAFALNWIRQDRLRQSEEQRLLPAILNWSEETDLGLDLDQKTGPYLHYSEKNQAMLDLLAEKFQGLVEIGILPVVTAGNDLKTPMEGGKLVGFPALFGTSFYWRKSERPAHVPQVYDMIIAGATLENGKAKRNLFAYNNDISIYAPGIGVITTAPVEEREEEAGMPEAPTGSSFSTALISGVAALLAADPQWNSELKDANSGAQKVSLLRQKLLANAYSRYPNKGLRNLWPDKCVYNGAPAPDCAGSSNQKRDGSCLREQTSSSTESSTKTSAEESTMTVTRTYWGPVFDAQVTYSSICSVESYYAENGADWRTIPNCTPAPTNTATCNSDDMNQWGPYYVDAYIARNDSSTFCNYLSSYASSDDTGAVHTFHEGTPSETRYKIVLRDGAHLDAADCGIYFNKIISQCDFNVESNPMNWKHGGLIDTPKASYYFRPLAKRPEPAPREPQAVCHVGRTDLAPANFFWIKGAGWGNNYQEIRELATKILYTCGLSRVPNPAWEFRFYEHLHENGMEWEAHGHTWSWDDIFELSVWRDAARCLEKAISDSGGPGDAYCKWI